VTSHRERNDRKAPFRGPQKGAPRGGDFRGAKGAAAGDPSGWIWGWHAAEAALANEDRAAPAKVLATAERAAQIKALHPRFVVQIMENGDIARHLPPGASHQGVAIQTPALEGVTLEALADPAEGFLLMLDQVTDPQNVGAIFRSAAAFGARGVILQDRHAPQLGGALAKAAAGAIESVPAARVVNLARALDKLADLGWTIVGLAGESDTPLETALDGRPAVLVMGSEGEGLRRLIGEHCDILAHIPMPGGFESLNVAAAAAIALYEASRRVGARVTGERG
jgi:23S rRNA (guanosine2251-2'-O)-methyltransferase